MDTVEGISQGSNRPSLEGDSSSVATSPLNTPLQSTGALVEDLSGQEISILPHLGRGSIVAGAEVLTPGPVTHLLFDTPVALINPEQRIPFKLNPAHSIASRPGDIVVLPAGTPVVYYPDDATLRVEADGRATGNRIQIVNGPERSTGFTNAEGVVSAGMIFSIVRATELKTDTQAAKAA